MKNEQNKTEMNNYQGLEVTKAESEWIRWYEQGSDVWQDAYAQYPARRSAKRLSHTYEKTAKSWFNKVLAGLHTKGIFLHCPFVFISTVGICWKHPGFENSGFVAESVQLTKEQTLQYFKPVL